MQLCATAQPYSSVLRGVQKYQCGICLCFADAADAAAGAATAVAAAPAPAAAPITVAVAIAFAVASKLGGLRRFQARSFGHIAANLKSLISLDGWPAADALRALLREAEKWAPRCLFAKRA